MTWIELTEGKQFSRLLYPNPVCFLCTSTPNHHDAKRSENIAKQQDEEDSPWSTTGNKNKKKKTAGNAALESKNKQFDSTVSADQNVMVISWLTATNNFGRFLFSMNRRRYTASRLFGRVANNKEHLQENQFVLCVPTADMEELVRNVGSVSGYSWSKFPQDHRPAKMHQKDSIIDGVSVGLNAKPVSKRQRKKQPRFPYGIPELQRTSIGGGEGHHLSGTNDALFAIKGTVAHLICHLYATQDDAIDPEHFLGLGEVTAAFVCAEYWCAQHNQFYPQNKGLPPYLAFLGAGKFGHVIVAPEVNEEDGHDINSNWLEN